MSDDDPAAKRHPFPEVPKPREYPPSTVCACGKIKPIAATVNVEGRHYCPPCVNGKR